MEKHIKWFQDRRLWVEFFALFNLAGLAPDILLAHSTNQFRSQMEYVPLVFSLLAPVVLVPALLAFKSRVRLWRITGLAVGWSSVVIGIIGLIVHLESEFFQQWTLASLVYAAPFAAPLAYTGIGFLLIMNRMVDCEKSEWAHWVLFLALGGFVGNLIFSVTDHAQNGFFRSIEWFPVASSALAVGFLTVPLLVSVNRRYLRLCWGAMAFQASVGLVGFALHLEADLHAVGRNFFEKVVHGAPIFAPMLFVDLALLACIALWVIEQNGLKARLDSPKEVFAATAVVPKA